MSSVSGSSGILSGIARRWWLIIACMFVGAIASIPAAWFYTRSHGQTPMYRSSSRLYVQSVGKPVDGKVPQPGAGMASQSEVISSAPLLAEVAAMPEIRNMEIMKGVGSPTAFIKAALTVTEDHDLITISFDSPNKVETARLVNAVADAFIAFIGKQRHNAAADVIMILREEKTQHEIELESQRKTMLEFQRSRGAFPTGADDQGNIVLQRLARLSELLTAAQLEAMNAKAILDTAEAAKADPARILAIAKDEQKKDAEANGDQGDISQHYQRLVAAHEALRTDIEETERRLDRLKRTRTPEHKDVKDAVLDLAILKAQLKRNEYEIAARKKPLADQPPQTQSSQEAHPATQPAERQKELDQKMVDDYLTKVRRRFQLARQREQMILERVNEQKKIVADANAAASEYSALEVEYNKTLRLVSLLDDRIKDAAVSEDAGGATVSIIEAARPADAPLRPNKVLVGKMMLGGVGVGLILGLIVGIGLTLILHFSTRGA